MLAHSPATGPRSTPSPILSCRTAATIPPLSDGGFSRRYSQHLSVKHFFPFNPTSTALVVVTATAIVRVRFGANQPPSWVVPHHSWCARIPANPVQITILPILTRRLTEGFDVKQNKKSRPTQHGVTLEPSIGNNDGASRADGSVRFIGRKQWGRFAVCLGGLF